MIGPQLADENLIESFRIHARWQSPAEVEERDGVLMLAGSSNWPGPYRNCAIRLDPSVPAGSAFQQAMGFFGARERGFVLLTRKRFDSDLEALLADAGIHPLSSSPCMILNRKPEVSQPAGDIELHPLDSHERLRDSVTVNMEAYPRLGMPGKEVASLFRDGERILADQVQVGGCVAYRDGVPLATALTFVTGTSAGIYWVGTLAAAERQGLAGACTRFAASLAFERGARLITLQSSPFGLAVYQRLGFCTYDSLGFYFLSRSQVS